MIETTVKMRVKINGLTQDEPPMLAYSKIVTRPDGKRKLFSQMAQVTDAELLQRLCRDARNGEEADIVIEQRLGNGIAIVLLEFTPISANNPVEVVASSPVTLSGC